MSYRPHPFVPLVAVLGTLLAGCWGGGGSDAAGVPSSFYGVISQGGPLSDRDLQEMENAHVGALRFAVPWSTVQPRADTCCNWSLIDRKVGTAATHGIQALPYIYGTPGWVNDRPAEPPVNTKAGQHGWKEFLTTFVQRYERGGVYWTNPSLYRAQHPDAAPLPVTAVQIWNEQNSPVFWQPRPDPAQYAELLKISYDAIHAANPSIKILDGGMFFSPAKRTAIHADRFLERLYQVRGVKRAFDISAIHPYAGGIGGVRAQIELMRQVMRKAGDARKKLWVTEIGWSSQGPSSSPLIKSPDGQARMLTQSFRLLRQQRSRWRIAGIVWYSWRDVSPAPCEFCAGSGLLTKNGKPKPALRAFERMTGA
jgi:polysaccharide biosynthesis protein PslG